MPTKILAQSPAPVTLGAGPTATTLNASGESLAARLAALPPGRSLYLVVRGLTAQQPPGVVYSVYLDLPAGATPAPNDPHRVGDLNFYNARPPGAANAPDALSPTNTDSEKQFYSFDLTALARTLRQRGQLADRTTVTLIPQGAPNPTAQAAVGRFELVEQ